MTAGRHLRMPAALGGAIVALLAAGLSLCQLSRAAASELSEELAAVSFKIVHETYRDGNWDLFMVNADGSDPVNLTGTPARHELYPHASPDGTKLCFVSDEGEGASKIRNVYLINVDGTGRTLLASNARHPCWKSNGTAIAYLKNESAEFSYADYATRGLLIHDLATGRIKEHPNKALHHLYNLCWSPDGEWFLATVHAGMGYRHGILAVEADGPGVYDLGIPGCRPDTSPDGKRIAWGSSDWTLRIADLDFSGPRPKIVAARDVVTSDKPMEIYHVDWSPCGKYVAYSRGPAKRRMGQRTSMVGVRADGWDIYVADTSTTNRCLRITKDGNSNKEPDWAPPTKEAP